MFVLDYLITIKNNNLIESVQDSFNGLIVVPMSTKTVTDIVTFGTNMGF